MTNQIIYCEKSCGKEFTLPPHQAYPITDGIEKNCFFCPYCGHEYVAYYTDAEIRGLQEDAAKVDRRLQQVEEGKPYYDEDALRQRRAKLKRQTQGKMRKLRERVTRDG